MINKSGRLEKSASEKKNLDSRTMKIMVNSNTCRKSIQKLSSHSSADYMKADMKYFSQCHYMLHIFKIFNLHEFYI